MPNLKATKDTGIIRGVVVDETILPIAGAELELIPGNLKTVSGEDGRFGYSDLEPGVYFIEAKADTFFAAQASTEVVAADGSPQVVRMIMRADASKLPFITPHQFKTFQTVSASVLGQGVVYNVQQLNDHRTGSNFTMPTPVDWLQTEVVWTPSTQLADTMRIQSNVRDQRNDILGSRITIGPSPLVQIYSEPEERNATIIYYAVRVGDGAQPVGVAIEQEAEIFSHAFHNFVPDAGWIFAVDGAHPVPGG